MADYLDNFVDPDGTLLSAHTADSGHKYESTTLLEIYANELSSPYEGTTSNPPVYVLESDGVTKYVTGSEFDVVVQAAYRSDNGEIAFSFCVVDSGNRYQIALAGASAVLAKFVGGAFTSLGSISIVDGDTITVEVRSGTLEVKKNGAAAFGPLSETDLTRAGYVMYPTGRGEADVTRGYNWESASITNLATTTPTITDINTNNEVTPGTTATLTGTNLTGATGFNIGSVSQTGFTVVSDTSITFTTVRGGNPYNQNLTGTLLHPDGNATITVQQVPESGTFAVTAASPNTTDDASLWTGLVDTVTGDPITITDGPPADQAWVKNPNNLTNLAIAADGTITADETGDFVVQIWLASEGVWGSDQTVTFTVPEEADNWPFGKEITPSIPVTWTWGRRHPKTNMRVRIYK